MWFGKPDTKPEPSVLGALRMADAALNGIRTGTSWYVPYDSRTFIRFRPKSILSADHWPRVAAPAWKAAVRAFCRGEAIRLPCRFDVVLLKNELILADFGSRSVTKCYRATGEDGTNDRGEDVEEAAERESSGIKYARARGIRVPALMAVRKGPMPMLRMEWKLDATKSPALRDRKDLPYLVFREADKLAESPRFAPAWEIASVRSAREVLETHAEAYGDRPVLRDHIARTLFLLGEGTLAEVPVHGDLSRNNVLFDAAGPFFMDWENFGKSCPGYDVFSFLSDAEAAGAMSEFVALLSAPGAGSILPSTSECLRKLAGLRGQSLGDCVRDVACVNFLLHLAYMVRVRKKGLLEVFLAKCERALSGWGAVPMEREGAPK